MRYRCDYCNAAEESDPCDGSFTAGCNSCMARMVACLPDWFPQEQRGNLNEYMNVLETLFGRGKEMEAHEEVKHWIKLVQKHKEALS